MVKTIDTVMQFQAKSGDWYNESSTLTVEVIARTIYGENTSNLVDQKAIAWVILNRYYKKLGGDTLREVALYGFEGYKNNAALQSKNPSDAGWQHATYLACLMCTNASENCWNELVGKPYGITNQIYFRSKKYLEESNTSMIEIDGNLYFKYDNGNMVRIYNVCIPGKGTATTKAMLRSMMGDEAYNVYFYHD